MPKVTRDAFLYLAPKKDKKNFAQCIDCRMFVPMVEGYEGGRCVIHGSNIEIDGDDSCGFMVEWPTPDGKPNPKVVKDHAEELAKGIPGSVTPKESGLVDRLVQCHRCFFERDNVTWCFLFDFMNKMAPEIFDFDINIERHACCNAQTSKKVNGVPRVSPRMGVLRER